MTESPKSLYQCSLEKVAFRLNCLVYFYKSGKLPSTLPKELDEPQLDIPSIVLKPHHESHARHLFLRRRTLNPEYHIHQLADHHQHNHDDEAHLEEEINRSDTDDDADDEDSEDKSDHHPLPGGPDRMARSLGEVIVNRILPSEEGFKKAMKKSYHSFVNTFIFGSSSGKKTAGVNLSGGLYGTSSLDNDLYDRLCNSYRVGRPICEEILQIFQRKYRISDRVLNLKIFQGNINQLSTIKLHDASGLSVCGLKFLKHHNIRRLQLAHLPAKCTVNELVDCLSDWSKENMEVFSVRYCSFSKFNKACLILSLTALTNVHTLDVSNTDFNNHGLEIITEDMPKLKSLNISCTKVTLLAPLQKTANRLTHLFAHNVSASCHDEHYVANLVMLKHLDLSDSRTYMDQTDKLIEFIREFSNFLSLTQLDISGRISVDYGAIEQLIIAKQDNPKTEPLRFLGLLETNLNFDDLQDLMRISKEPLLMTGKLFQALN